MKKLVKDLIVQNQMLATRMSMVEALVHTKIGAARYDPTVTDPPPGEWGWGGNGGGGFGPPQWWDPAPTELASMSRVQFEARLGDITAMRAKLDLAEGMYKEGLAGLQQ